MALTLDDLLTSPDHYLHSFDGDNAVFVPMDRAAYRRSIFLDGRISAAAAGSMRVPVAILDQAPLQPKPVNWIFHVAHCGSTLLARALDRDNIVLREPLALRQCAVAAEADRWAVVKAMLGKRYGAGPTLVKANVPVNFNLPDVVDADARAILLYCGLNEYLLAVLRTADYRKWLGRVTEELGRNIDGPPAANDAERAAALWLAQMRAFVAAIARTPNARSLDAETFFSQPGATLAAASRLLEIPMTEAAIAGVINGPLFAADAKKPGVPFDNQVRLARRAASEAGLANELSQAARWVERAGGEVGLAKPLL